MSRDLAADALARNERYLREVVETLSVCPFARPCRESGRLLRAVIETETPEVEVLAQRHRELLTGGPGGAEVVLLILPRFTGGATALEQLATSLAALTDAGDDGWTAVAFHPELEGDTTTAARTVRLLRRAPDPTLQLVRRVALKSVQADHPDQTRYLDPRALERGLPPPSPPSLSEMLLARNHATARKLGPQVVALLASLRR